MMGMKGGNGNRWGSQAQIRDLARRRLTPDVWDWMECGSGDQATLGENLGALSRIRFRPRYLRGINRVETATTFMGIPLSIPVMTAPFGCDTLFHPQGHVGVARANQRFGTASLVPEACGFALEHIAAEAPAAARIFQIAAGDDEAHFLGLATRARDAGYGVLCVLIDSPVVGWKDGIRASGFEPDPRSAIANYGPDIRTTADIYARRTGTGEGAWDWARLGEVLARASMPFIVKGILTAEDAVAAAGCGAGGIVVSNLGGRSLDCVPSSIEQLPEIAAAVGDRVDIALDSGIRRGSDILKALALGAQVVIIGRAAIYALAAGGQDGVFRSLELFREELEATMILAGVASVREASPDLLMSA